MLLAIDYGARRIGLALADETDRLVLPFKELANRGVDQTIKELSQIINQEKITKIIIGLPLSLSGKSSLKTNETQKFIDILAKNIDIPVITIDERLTSKLADTMSAGTKGSRDVGAAMIILEDFLSRMRE